MPEDAPAITTQYESLWIGTSFAYGNLKEIKWIVSAPELSATPPRVDATNFCSEQRTYVVGLPDYAVDMEWVCNCQASANPRGNLAQLMELDPDTVYCVERRLYAAGVNVRIRGRVSWSLSGASVNGIQQVTIRVTPEADLTIVPVETYQGKATVYYAGSMIGGSTVVLEVNGQAAPNYIRLRSNSLTAELKSETRTAPPPSCAFLPARTEISCLDETVVPEIEPVLARLKLSPGQRAARHQPSMSQTRPR